MGNVINMIGGGKPTQEKTVSPTAAGLIVTPDAGKLLNKVTVNGDSDLVAGNIKKGVDIFGVNGSFDNSEGLYAYQKYGADKYERLFVSGSEAYRELEGITDDIIDVYKVVGGYRPTFDESTNQLYIPNGIVSNATLLGELSKGSTMDLKGGGSYFEYFCWKHGEPLSTTQPILGNAYIRLLRNSDYAGAIDWTSDLPKMIISYGTSGEWIVCVNKIIGEPNGVLVSNNILSQQGVVRIPANILTDMWGFTKFAEDTFTPSSKITLTSDSAYTIAHSLNTTPLGFILYRKSLKVDESGTLGLWIASAKMPAVSVYFDFSSQFNGSNSANYAGTGGHNYTLTDSNIQIKKPYYNMYLQAGVEHTLITMA